MYCLVLCCAMCVFMCLSVWLAVSVSVCVCSICAVGLAIVYAPLCVKNHKSMHVQRAEENVKCPTVSFSVLPLETWSQADNQQTHCFYCFCSCSTGHMGSCLDFCVGAGDLKLVQQVFLLTELSLPASHCTFLQICQLG